jgi:fructokinase
MYVGVETGGTKVVVAIGAGPGKIVAETRIATTTPRETLHRVSDWVDAEQADIQAVGVASFGPLDLRPDSPTYGRITTTPKPGWSDTDLVGWFADRHGLPVGLDTDVNAAALAEHRWGAGTGEDDLVYLTVGTGIGGGAIVRGRPVHGLIHTEMGHVPVLRHPDDRHPGSCPFHADCLEGLAAGPTLQTRYGRPAQTLGGDQLHQAVELEAWYLAQLVTTVTYLLSPERIVLGGGVSHLPDLIDAVRDRTRALLAGALASPRLAGTLDEYIVPPGLGDRAGILGALALAADATHRSTRP